MAQRPCTSCNKQIDSFATTCPHCGAAPRPFFQLISGALLFIVVFSLIKGCLSQ